MRVAWHIWLWWHIRTLFFRNFRRSFSVNVTTFRWCCVGQRPAICGWSRVCYWTASVFSIIDTAPVFLNFSITLFTLLEVKSIFRRYFVRNLRTVVAKLSLSLKYCSMTLNCQLSNFWGVNPSYPQMAANWNLATT